MSDDWNLRQAAERDGAACAAIYAPYVRDTAVTFETDPPSPAEMGRRIGWKHGRWHDVAWAQLAIADGDDPPAEPR